MSHQERTQRCGVHAWDWGWDVCTLHALEHICTMWPLTSQPDETKGSGRRKGLLLSAHCHSPLWHCWEPLQLGHTSPSSGPNAACRGHHYIHYHFFTFKVWWYAAFCYINVGLDIQHDTKIKQHEIYIKHSTKIHGRIGANYVCKLCISLFGAFLPNTMI